MNEPHHTTEQTSAMRYQMNLPPLKPSDYPEPRIMHWSKMEMDFIQEYARRAVREAVAASELKQAMMYLALTDAMGYESGQTGIENSTEEWAAALLKDATAYRDGKSEAVAAAVPDMTQKDIDEMCRAMRAREFTWDQVNVAVELFRRHLALGTRRSTQGGETMSKTPKMQADESNGEPDSLHIAAMDLARKQYDRIAELESALRHARVFCEWIREKPHQLESINILSARTEYRISKLLKD